MSAMGFIIRPGAEEDTPEMLRLRREMMDFHARVEPRFRPAPTPAGEQAWEKHLREDIWRNEECVFEPDSGKARSTTSVGETSSSATDIIGGEDVRTCTDSS